jgi:purine-binding chemotaxis protein CheW
MAAVIRDLAQVNAELQDQKERAEDVDCKMITFSLAGKDYGVDIMNVKEIAKADKFTFVPNAPSFVRGVYNLRGDIIPIIDLRIFFHMSYDTAKDGFENLLILHINDQVYGTIVDKIDKVVGVNHENIQPPHPIFGDINIKYISGVVEKQGALYIILDVVRIFTVEEDKSKIRSTSADSADYFVPPPEQVQVQRSGATDSAFGFVTESLAALRKFTVSPLNEVWLRRRFDEWSTGRSDSELQLKGVSDADQFLSTFDSPYTGEFWRDDYASAIVNALPDKNFNSINAWNLGCGKGYETYSFACILKNKYPDARIKIWANDSDIMVISQAPNMVFDMNEVPRYCQGYLVRGKNGCSFNQVIKDSIVFEYHDIVNDNPLPDLDFILARDILSFLSANEQTKIVSSFAEKLKMEGTVFIGRNEELTGTGWRPLSSDPVSAFAYMD